VARAIIEGVERTKGTLVSVDDRVFHRDYDRVLGGVSHSATFLDFSEVHAPSIGMDP